MEFHMLAIKFFLLSEIFRSGMSFLLFASFPLPISLVLVLT